MERGAEVRRTKTEGGKAPALLPAWAPLLPGRTPLRPEEERERAREPFILPFMFFLLPLHFSMAIQN